MEQLRGFKIRIYPTKTQETQILKTLGCCRFLWNKMLAERIETYEQLKDDKKALYVHEYRTEKYYKNEFEWLKEADSISLQQTRLNLIAAYQNFFRRVKKGDKEKGYPKFKRKHNKSSYNTVITGNNIQLDFEKKKVKLPKLSWMSFRDPRIPENFEIRSATVSRTSNGKYYCSLILKYEVLEPKRIDLKAKGLRTKGLDMSLQNFYVDEQGNSPAFRKMFRTYEKKIAELEQWKSKTNKGSCKRRRIQMRINRVWGHITECRRDFIEKLSRQLVNENDVIVVETLQMQDMARHRLWAERKDSNDKNNHGKSVNDLCWATFLARLKQKAEETGKFILEADKWFASSKICNQCGYKHQSLKLEDREWTCENCGKTHSRDQNAAINLRDYGINSLQELQFERVDNESDQVTMHEWQSSF